MSSRVKSILEDLRRKELIAFKVLAFLIYGGQASIYPFLNIHLWSLNLSLTENTIILALQPVFGIIAVLLVQKFVEKINNVKAMFCLFLIVSAVSVNCLQFIPENQLVYSDVNFSVDCKTAPKEPSRLNILTNHSCALNKNIPETVSTTVNFTECQGSNSSFQTGLPREEATYFCFGNYTPVTETCVRCNSSISVEITGSVVFSSATSTGDGLPFISIKSVTYEGASYQNFRCTGSSSCFSSASGNGNFCDGDRSSENSTKTFWLSLAIRLVITVATTMVCSLYDAALSTALEKINGHLEYQRFWAAIAVCVISPLSGYFLDTKLHEWDVHNYSGTFYMYSIFYLGATLVSVFLDFNVKTYPKQRGNFLKSLTKSPVSIYFLLNLLFLGMSWGFLENFQLLYMHNELGSDHLVVGLATALGCFVCILSTVETDWVTSKLGYVNVLFCAFLSYALKFSGFYFIKSGVFCLPLEILDSFTITLLIYGVTVCWTKISISGVNAAMFSWSTAHFILGRILGTVASGLIGSRWNMKTSHLVFAFFNLTMAIVCLALQFVYRKCKSKDTSYDHGDIPEIEQSDQENRSQHMRIASSVSCLVFPFFDVMGLSPFHIDTFLRISRGPTLAEEIWKRVNGGEDIQNYYSGSASDRTRRKSAFTGRAPPSSRRSSVVSFRSSLAPVPEEILGTFTPEVQRRPSTCSSVDGDRIQFELEMNRRSLFLERKIV